MRNTLILTLVSLSLRCFGQEENCRYKQESMNSIPYNRTFLEQCPCENWTKIAFENLQRQYVTNKDTNNLIILYTSVLTKKLDPECRNYRSRMLNAAADGISAIYLAQKKYAGALYYLYKCDTEYTNSSSSGCGNEIAANQIKYANRFADIFLATNREEQALEALLKQAFNDEGSSHIKRLVPLLLKRYTKGELKSEMAKAVMTPESSDRGFYVTFINRRLSAWYWSYPTQKETIEHLKYSHFYKEVMAL